MMINSISIMLLSMTFILLMVAKSVMTKYEPTTPSRGKIIIHLISFRVQEVGIIKSELMTEHLKCYDVCKVDFVQVTMGPLSLQDQPSLQRDSSFKCYWASSGNAPPT